MTAAADAFEARYRTDPDPWDTLTSDYEREKRRQTLEACGPGPFAAACDLGAGTGALAIELAPRCERLVAFDGAPTAVAAASERLAPFAHAEARVAAVPEGLPDGESYDLIVASEILYYLDDAALEATMAWIDRALKPGGRLVAVHWTGTAPDLRRDAVAVGDALARGVAGRRETVVDGQFRLEVVAR
ncbi:class I SAM-dependent DNA methyltransferase [Baekduia sp. Peel2402]|uniref:class I SAM-dependent DNA methyltransferase n=1 Tax=Baekduia sp. Peel2402 TaxID=3458296 RepID=UPI00403E79BB